MKEFKVQFPSGCITYIKEDQLVDFFATLGLNNRVEVTRVK